MRLSDTRQGFSAMQSTNSRCEATFDDATHTSAQIGFENRRKKDEQ